MSAKKTKWAGYGKIALIGVAGVGLYYAVTRLMPKVSAAMKTDGGDSLPPPVSSAFTMPFPAMAPGAFGKNQPPDLSGPRVSRGVLASTKTTIMTEKKYPGMKYARIIKTDRQGYREFLPPVNGIFTRRLLAVKGKLWAEIKPA